MVKNLKNQKIFNDSYDKLFIASGASPFVPQKSWLDLKNVTTAASLEDVNKIIKQVNQAKKIAIVGGGFIGVELAENLHTKNKEIIVIEKASLPVYAQFDEEFSNMLKEEIINSGIKCFFNEGIKDLITKNQVAKKIVTDKQIFDVDLIILALGFKPNTSFLGPEFSKASNRALITDKQGQTSIKNVWAPGDCALVYNKITNENSYWPLAINSRKMANIVFKNIILNQKVNFLGSLGSSGLRLKSIEMFRTGTNKRDLEKTKITSKSVMLKGKDCAQYSGKAEDLWLKIYANEKQEIIGAQAFGKNKSAAMRIGILAMAANKKTTLNELENFDLFYTPPFTSATDIIHIAARELKKQY